MKNPLVSIIIPIYNVEKYLNKCIKSLLESSYKNLEIILINDCSPDACEEIIEKYSEKDKRILYVKNTENLRVSETRNRGLKRATGKYIMFVDGDDYISTDWIENLVETIEEKSADIVIGAAKQFNEQEEKDYKISDLDREKWIDFSKVRMNNNGVIWNKIYRRDLIAENNIQFDKEIYKHSDVEFTYRSLALSDKIFYSTKGFYYYRIDNESSIMRTIDYSEKIKYTTMLLKNIHAFSEKTGKKNKKLLKKLAVDVMKAHMKSNRKFQIEKSLVRKSGFFIPEIQYLKFLRKNIKNII